MKIAILGGGIAGMSSALALNFLYPDSQITLFTKELGGQYALGGLKYLKYTNYTKHFMEKCLPDVNYPIKCPIGAIYYNGDFHNFPLHMFGILDAKELQKKYWKKTGRDINEFDNRCVNDAFNIRTELSIDIEPETFVSFMTVVVKKAAEVIYGDIDIDLFRNILLDYDLVIYTLPLSIISMLFGAKLKTELVSSDLSVHKFKADKKLMDKIWFDYVYLPNNDYPFHRLSVDRFNNEIHAEINNLSVINEDVKRFLKCSFGHSYSYQMDTISIKGQITTDVDDKLFKKLPDNLVLLGRFAQWDKRITWDNVIENLFTNKKFDGLYIKSKK